MSWEEAKVVALLKPGEDPKFPQNLCPIILLPLMGKVFEKVILEIVKIRIRERNLLNACMRLADHVTLNFNNNMSTAAVILDIEKAFDTTWHRVPVEGEMSMPSYMQGSVLSLTLYNFVH
jgi:hypothetical protein